MLSNQIIICTREEAGVSYQQIVNLMHESFQERLDQGLHYSCSFMTEDQFRQKTRNGIVFVAIDNITGTLVGTNTLNILNDDGKKYGYMEYVAVKSSYKHSGVGAQILHNLRRKALDANCSYILSDTSTKATSAVQYHLKNGFKIIGLESYRSTNYWSYVFRMQLVPSLIWNNSVFLKIHYWCSFVFIRLTRNIDGSDRWIGKLYKKLIKCKN